MTFMDTPERIAVIESDDSLCERIFGLIIEHGKNRVCTQFQNYEDFYRNKTVFNAVVFDEKSYMHFLKDDTMCDLLADSAQRSFILSDDNGANHPYFVLRRPLKQSSEEISAKIEAVEDEFLRELFLKLGFRHNLTGCRYLKAAIKLASRDSSYLNKGITKRLYPKLAELFDSNPSSIERGIRHALSVCFDNGKFKAQSAVFGNCFDNCHCPTNGEFIALVADMLSTRVKSIFATDK